MDDFDLARLLRDSDLKAWRLAVDALEGGAKYERQGYQDTFSACSIFRRRLRLAVKGGQYSVGFRRAVDALTSWSGRGMVIGTIEDHLKSGLSFQVFLDEREISMIACFGIEPPYLRGKFPRVKGSAT